MAKFEMGNVGLLVGKKRLANVELANVWNPENDTPLFCAEPMETRIDLLAKPTINLSRIRGWVICYCEKLRRRLSSRETSTWEPCGLCFLIFRTSEEDLLFSLNNLQVLCVISVALLLTVNWLLQHSLEYKSTEFGNFTVIITVRNMYVHTFAYILHNHMIYMYV